MIGLLSTLNASRSARRRLAVLTVLTACALALGSGARAQADTAFVTSVSNSSLPSTASTTSGDWQLVQTACDTGGHCVAVGFDKTSGAPSPHALMMPITNGIAGAATEVPLPANAMAAAVSRLGGVSCQGSGSCTAIGSYTLQSGSIAPMVVQITNGVPATAVQVSLPSSAEHPWAGNLFGLACPAAGGTCVAAGYFYTTASASSAMVVPINAGVPATGVAVPLPANASTSNPRADLVSVACQTVDSCIAVGYYALDSQHLVPTAVPVSDGVPATAVAGPVPSDHNGGPDGSESWIACPPAGSCQTFGGYNDSSGQEQVMVTPTTGSGFGTPTTITLPNLYSPYDIYNNGISCSSAALCVDAGYYENSSQQYVDYQVNITPSGTTVALAPPPAGADTNTIGLSGFDGVACVTAGPCLSAGFFATGTGQQQGMQMQTSATGTIGAATEAQVTSGSNTTAPDNALVGIACSGAGSCVEPGADLTLAGGYEPYVISQQAPLTVSTTSLPAGTLATSYHAQLGAAGAWGSYGWALSAGSLPAGLSLNAQSGAITGTPTAAGSASFTVQATGTGAPAQTASQALSITVPAIPPPPPPVTAVTPVLRILGGSGLVKRDELEVSLDCSAATCAGTLTLQARLPVTVKHGHKRVHTHRLVTLGSRAYTAAAGATVKLQLVLSSAGRRVLAAARHHRLSVKLIATVTNGQTVSLQETLRAVVAHKKKKNK